MNTRKAVLALCIVAGICICVCVFDNKIYKIENFLI